MMVNRISQSNSLSANIVSAHTNDSKTKGIQSQITVTRQQLQKLSSNPDMTAEEKRQARQAAQQEIKDLNKELQKRENELRKKRIEEQAKQELKAQEQKKEAIKAENLERLNAQSKTAEPAEKEQAASDDKKVGKEENGRQREDIVVSQDALTALVSADTAKNQSRAEQMVGTALKGEARAIQGEIAQDALRGQKSKAKEEQLQALKDKISNTSRAQLSLLSGASKSIQSVNVKAMGLGIKEDAGANSRLVEEAGVPRKEPMRSAIHPNNAGNMFASVGFRL